MQSTERDFGKTTREFAEIIQVAEMMREVDLTRNQGCTTRDSKGDQLKKPDVNKNDRKNI
jgi:hypothetical protein